MNTGLVNTVLIKLTERGGELDAISRSLPTSEWKAVPTHLVIFPLQGPGLAPPAGSTPLSPNVGPGKRNTALSE